MKRKRGEDGTDKTKNEEDEKDGEKKKDTVSKKQKIEVKIMDEEPTVNIPKEEFPSKPPTPTSALTTPSAVPQPKSKGSFRGKRTRGGHSGPVAILSTAQGVSVNTISVSVPTPTTTKSSPTPTTTTTTPTSNGLTTTQKKPRGMGLDRPESLV